MGIYKRGRVWWIDLFDQNKRRVFESSRSTSRREAERLLAIRQADVGRGQFQVVPKIALGEFSKKYMGFAKANKASWDRDAGMLKHIQGFFGDWNLTDVAPMDVEEYKVLRSSLVERSTVTLTMRHAHTNKGGKRDAVQNLVPQCDNSVTMPPKSHRGLKIVTRKV
jgi:hypothetical protein